MQIRAAAATAVVIIIVIIIISVITVAIIAESSHTATIIDIDHYFRGCSAMTFFTCRKAHSLHRHRHLTKTKILPTTTTAARSPLYNREFAYPEHFHDDVDLGDSCGVPFTTSSSTSSTPTTKDYWKLRTLRRQYERANKILYVKSALAPTEFATISYELSFMMQATNSKTMMKLQDEDASSSFATNRIGAPLPTNSETYNILRHGSVRRIVNGLYGNEMILAPNIPIEVRVYEKMGAGMEWHVDDILYCPRQVEIVLTLENTSDCCTMWRAPTREKEENEDEDRHAYYCNSHFDHDEPSSLPSSSSSSHRTVKMPATAAATAACTTFHSIQTAPNSILILEAGGVEHKVTPLSYGKRIILKMAYVSKDAVMDPTMERHASHHHLARRRTRSTSAADQKKAKRRSRRKT